MSRPPLAVPHPLAAVLSLPSEFERPSVKAVKVDSACLAISLSDQHCSVSDFAYLCQHSRLGMHP